jgi:hypothetical protein
MMTTTTDKLFTHGDPYLGELERNVRHHPLMRSYWPRLSTRIVVTNTLEAHKADNAPKDVAVYYFVPGSSDEHLPFLRTAILRAWLRTIAQHSLDSPVGGPSRGVLEYPAYLDLTIEPLNECQRDQIHSKGYNLVRFMPELGPVIWGTILWRNGQPVAKEMSLLKDDFYKHHATPLALME